MEITVNVGDLDLDTVVGKVVRMAQDYDGAWEETEGEQLTLGHYVIKAILEKAVAEQWPGLRERVRDLRDEEIRQYIGAQVAEAASKPIPRTNRFGEKAGEPVTLIELILQHTDEIIKGSRANARDGFTVLLRETITAYMHRNHWEAMQRTIQDGEKDLKARGEQAIADAVGRLRGYLTAEGLKEADKILAEVKPDVTA